jgi:sec-independent protein translocase protein TatA
MGGFSLWHILIFAVILLLLFGGNRFSSMMGDVAKGIKSFKHGLADDEKQPEPRQLPPQQPQAQQQPIDITPPARPADPAPMPPADDQPRT